MRRLVLALASITALGLTALAGGLWFGGGINPPPIQVDADLVLHPGEAGELRPIGDFAFAAVSDLHFGKVKDAEAAELVRSIPSLEGAPFGDGRTLGRPQFVLTCGDNVNNGEGADAAAQYRRFKSAMDGTGLPYYYANGNHDVYGAKDSIEGLRREPFAAGRAYYRFEHEGVHFLVLNFYTDTEGDTPPAELDPEQRAWFRAALLEIGPRAPIVLVFHPLPERWSWLHMPPWIAMTRDSATFLASTIQEFRVVAILCGHYHLQHVEGWHGVPVLCIGSWSNDHPFVVAGQVEAGRFAFVSYRNGDRSSGRVLVER